MIAMSNPTKIVTVTLNPAIDQTVAIANFTAGSVNRVESQRCDAGGKGVNVAAFLADYGFDTAATGFLGRDNQQVFERFFKEKKIADHFVRIAGSTRTGIKIIDRVRQQTTDINFPGQSPAGRDTETLLAKITQLAAERHWFVLAGSIPKAMSPGIYGELIRTIGRQGARVALDTSGEAFDPALDAGPALIKPNIDELEAYMGRRLDGLDPVVAAARSLLSRGVETVVVSMGAEGAVFVEKNAALQAIPPQVEVMSTVGAGDAMLSGTLAAKIEQRDLAQVARLATAFAVVAVTHIGAGLPQSVRLSEIEAQVTLKNL
jgi:1-phosphofructokinase